MGISKYQGYKDSDVEWLGDVPEHWEAKPLKYAVRYWTSNVDKKSVEGQDSVLLCNYTDVYYNDKIKDGMNFMSATATRDQIEKFSLKAGDTVITKDSETAYDIAVAAYVPEDLPGVICGYHLGMMRPHHETHGSFIKWLFDSSYIKAKVAVRANGLTRVGLGQDAVTSLELPLPPLCEQKQIATFLDRETSKIDALVSEQRRLIELLKEKRQAVISHAVTKGLNPNAPMKPSNIPWLGDVPEHWTLCTLRRASSFIDGDRGGEYPNENDLVSDGVLFLSSKNIVRGKLDLSEAKFISNDKFETLNRGKTQHRDLIVKVRGSAGRIGELAIFDTIKAGFETAFINAQMMIIRTSERLLPEYLCHVAESTSWNEQLLVAAYGTAQQQLNNKVFEELHVVLPPVSEQIEIASWVTSRINEFNLLESKSIDAISLLQERRTALISAAVTGKIDVRNAVPEPVS